MSRISRLLRCRLFRYGLMGSLTIGAMGTSCATPSANKKGNLADIYDNNHTGQPKLRIINGSGHDLQILLRVDGEMMTLPVCTAATGSCQHFLETCPERIELIEEIRLDHKGVFQGGRHFEGRAEYTWEPGEFTCDSTFLFNLNQENFTIDVY